MGLLTIQYSYNVHVHCGASLFMTFSLDSAGGLRLSGTGKGRLDVLHSGTWGMVCDDGFEEREARAACSQLGFPDLRDPPSTYSPSDPEPPLEKVVCENLYSAIKYMY